MNKLIESKLKEFVNLLKSHNLDYRISGSYALRAQGIFTSNYRKNIFIKVQDNELFKLYLRSKYITKSVTNSVDNFIILNWMDSTNNYKIR